MTQLNPYWVLGWTNSLVCALFLNKKEEVIKINGILEREYPDDAIALEMRAKVLITEKKFDDALMLLKKSIKKDPTHFASLISECDIYLTKGQFTKVIRKAKKGLENCADSEEKSQLYIVTGNAWEGIGKIDKAKKFYKRAENVKLKPISLLE